MNPKPPNESHRQPSSPGVPLLDLKRQFNPLHEEITAALGRVCESGWYVLGPEVEALERDLAAYSHAEHGVGCASGSDALLLALMAYDVGPGDEVILPSFTFFATASAVTRLGATPVFADIDPITLNIDPEAVSRCMGSATKAIVPVHLFGQCADIDALARIAKTQNVPLVEDAAQAVGAEFMGRRAGSLGDVGCFSFYPTKNLGGAGDGGMLTTNRADLAEKLRLLRVHGMRPRYYHEMVGINSRLDAFQAAVLNVKLPHLDRWTAMRAINAERYTERFTLAGLDRVLGLPSTPTQGRHVWNQYVVRVPDGRRDALREFLAEAKIGTEIYYPVGLHEQQCFANLGYDPGDLPETYRASREVLALPIFPELTDKEQKVVVDRIRAFFNPSSGQHTLPASNFLPHTTGPGTLTPNSP